MKEQYRVIREHVIDFFYDIGKVMVIVGVIVFLLSLLFSFISLLSGMIISFLFGVSVGYIHFFVIRKGMRKDEKNLDGDV